MTELTDLPFEYPFRWGNKDLAKAAGIDTEARALLEQRDRDLEDYLASLDLSPGGGSTVEAFSYVIDFTTTITNESAVLAESSGSFATSGVSLSSDTITINLPAGTWLLGLNVSIDEASFDPTTGRYYLGFSPASVSPIWEYVGSVDYTELAAFITPTISGSVLVHQASAFTVKVDSYNAMDEPVYLYGTVWGVQQPTSTVTVV